MDFTPIEVSKTEHGCIVDAEKKFGELYKNCENLLNLLWNFIEKIEIEANVFASFLSQVRKFAFLALLSALRQHNTQALMNVRQMLEAGVLAAYSFKERDTNAYYYKDKYGVGHEKKGIKGKAYEWLEKNYKKHSDTVKGQKKIINNMWAHPSILTAHLNCNVEDGCFSNFIFDKKDEMATKNALWLIGNSCFLFLDLYATLIVNFKLGKLSNDFHIKMKQLGQENQLLKDELMQNPRIKKWLEIIKKEGIIL